MDAYIFGKKTYAEVVAELAKNQGYKILDFMDDFSPVADLQKFRQRIISDQIPVFLGVGYKDLPARQKLIDKFIADGVKLPNLIHPHAVIGACVQMGAGNIIMAQAIVESFSTIGNGNVFWPQAALNHHGRVGHNNFFSPASCVCGVCEIENGCFIGAGATIVDHCKVPSGTFVKAGALFKNS